jgi:hypothetical protein
MNATRIESIPQTWTDADVEFFGIVATLFAPRFTAGASALLAGNDAEDEIDTAVTSESRELVYVYAPLRTR